MKTVVNDSVMDEIKSEMMVLLERFSIILADELRAIKTRDVDALEEILQHKNELTSALENLTAAIRPNELDAEDFHFPLAWQDLRALAAHCARANRANGGAIDLNQNLTMQLLDIMRGLPPQSRTYDHRARLSERGGRRSFARA